MKNLLILIISFSFSISYSQKNNEITSKIYKDTTKNLYVNKDMGLYLWISPTPNKDDKNMQKLESLRTADYANPFYLDTEGENTIRASSRVNKKTKKIIYPKQEIIFKIIADGKSPVTRTKYFGSKKYLKNGNIYYGKNLKVSLSSRDAFSGVEKIFYSSNSNTFSEYKKELNLNTEGENSFRYYSVDNVGNSEKINENKFIVDITPPVTIFEKEGDISENNISGRSYIKLKSEDNISGVKNIKYYFDENKPRIYTGRISLALLNDGKHKLYFFAEDNVGNIERKAGDVNKESFVKKEIEFYLDKKVPGLSASVVGDQYKGKYLYVSPRSKIKIDAADNKSRIKEVRYSINKVAKNNIYSDPFLLFQKTGRQTIYFNARDKVNNLTRNNSFYVFYDDKIPNSGITYKLPQHFNRDTLFINKNTEIVLFSQDSYSGVLKTEYSIDDGALKTYTDKFKISEEGFHKISFKATDKVNNIEKEKISYVYVDNTPPEIFIKFSIEKIDTQKSGNKIIDIYPKFSKLFPAATDNRSGTKSIHYSLNQGEFKHYTLLSKEKFKEAKHHNIRVVSKDELGNKSEKTLEFIIR